MSDPVRGKRLGGAVVLGAVAVCGTVAWALAAPGAPTASAPGANSASRSLLLITLDTTRHDALSPCGAPAGDTPHLTRFADGAARFEDAYSALNVTNPSHLSILTGLPARSHGVFDNKTRTRPGQTSLVSAFRTRGYETVAFPAAWPPRSPQPCKRRRFATSTIAPAATWPPITTASRSPS